MFETTAAIDGVLLNEFNHRVRTLMRHLGRNGAPPDGPESQLRAILQRTFLAEWIQDRYIIAVTGVQGAGKTTLIQQLYDLPDDGLLAPNTGRGERLPILVMEADIPTPVASAWSVKPAQDGGGLIVEPELTRERFQFLAKGDDEKVLMLELQVPLRHFKAPNMGFMLLPGFERRSSRNQFWQALVSDVLALADTCVYVTDPTLWADGLNKVEVEEAFRSTFKEAKPILVVARSDHRDPELENQLRERMAHDLGIEDPGRVISTGVAPDGAKPWVEALIGALEQHRADSRGLRTAQLRMFHKVLSDDLHMALVGCDGLVGKLAADADKDHYGIKKVLEVYDRSARGLKDAVAKQLFDDLQGHAKTQADLLKKQTILDRGKWDTFTNFLSGKSLKDNLKADEAMAKAWAGGEGVSPRACLAHALTEVAQKRLFLFPGTGIPALHSGDFDQPQKALGYQVDSELPALGPGEAPYLVEGYGLHQQLKRLLNPPEAGQDPSRGMVFDEPTLGPAVQVLPLLAGELLRLAAFEPAWFGAGTPCSGSDALEQTVLTFQTLHGHKKQLLNGIGGMLGLQGACDSIPELVKGFALMLGRSAAVEEAALGGVAIGSVAIGESVAGGTVAAGTTAAAIASVAGAVAMGAVLAIAVIRVHLGQGIDEAANIDACLEAILNKQMQDYLFRLEELLSLFRERLENSLAARYHQDASLGRNVNLAIALADMKETRRQMMDMFYDLEESLGVVL